MSKKMMKRSLALGALMAFVITGSAMAHSINETGDYSTEGKGNGSLAYGPLPHSVNVGGKLTIISPTDVGIQGYGDVTAQEIVIDTYTTGIDGTKNDGNLNVSADKITITNKQDNGIQLNGGIGTNINVKDFNSLTVSAKGHGISNNGNGEINLVGNTGSIIDITAAENAVYTRIGDGGKILVSAKDVSIESNGVGGTDKGHAIYAKGANSEVVVNATNDLELTTVAGKNAVKTNSNANVYLSAGKDITVTGTIQGNFDVDAKNGTLKVTTTGDNTNYGLHAQSDAEYLKECYRDKVELSPQENIVSVKDLNVESAGMALYAEGANLVVNAENVTLTSKLDGGIYVDAYSNGGGITVEAGAGRVNMNVTDSLTINAAGYGVSLGSTGPSKNVNIIGGTVDITAGETGVYTRGSNIMAEGYSPNAINITGSKVTVTSIGDAKVNNKYYKGHAVYANGASINILATDEVKLTAAQVDGKNAIYATTQTEKDGITKYEGNQGKVVIGSVEGSAADVIVNGNITAEDKASISVDFAGAKSVFNGMVNTAAEANTTLSFGNGATWNLNENASTVTNATFASGSNLVISGEIFEASNGVYALNGSSAEATLNVSEGAKLTVDNIKETTYNIANNFKNLADAKDKWDVTDINPLMQGVLWTSDKGLQVEVFAKNSDDLATDTGLSQGTAGLVQNIIQNANKADTPAENAVVDFLNNVIKNNNSDAAVGNAINNATKMAEAGGNSATAANIVKNVTGVTNDRLSFNCGHSAPHKGGHGVGLFEEGSGADIWVEYVHGKDEVENLPSTAGATSYEGQYNGIVMGVDFKKVNKFQSGVAFNYGEGDTNSVGSVARTHSDYDFWGIGYYGNIHNDDNKIIFDVNYAKTDSDVTQSNSGTTFEASPETTTWSAGVKLEKLYQNENVQIVPYTGLRYMSIDSDDYSTTCGAFNYSMERQDIWLLPLGVSIRQEIANDNGWTVSPRVDLSYIWAFGDTNSNMEVKSPFAGVSQLGYDVMDDGSFLGLVGIEAHKGQWGYGVSYSYQKGDHSESKKWYVDVNYSF